MFKDLFSLPRSVFLPKGLKKERIWQINNLLNMSSDGSQSKGEETEKVSDEEVTASVLKQSF